jgi:GNAT superfamily N-acetyltransferase
MNDTKPIIRLMQPDDVRIIATTMWHANIDIALNCYKWEKYLGEQQAGIRHVYVVVFDGHIIGYASLLLLSPYKPFSTRNIPEINDLWIDKEYRNRGFATHLIAHLEESARNTGHGIIGIGVGLYADYGAAQRLYVRLGYIPDGLGITYDYDPVIPGNQYCVDDELILWMTKKL